MALFGYFAMLSLFAVGGANAAIPEMHRIAVEVMHWMSDLQFADMFAIAQLSPGPNVITCSFAASSGGGRSVVDASSVSRQGSKDRATGDRRPCPPPGATTRVEP